MYEVKDGARTLQFSGEKLAESSSWRPDALRWIEFELHKTSNGSYVLSRTGVSLVFHASTCPLVQKYGLTDSSVVDLTDDAYPCVECSPTLDLPYVFPEKDRHWAQVSEDPEAVLGALYKYDDNGAKYLTKVAARLLDSASRHDAPLASIYLTERIA